MHLSRAALSDFDALCTVEGRTVAAFGIRKASAVISRFAVPLLADASAGAEEVLGGGVSTIDGNTSQSNQLFAAAMHRPTLNAAIDSFAMAGRALESRGEACGPSIRLAARRARLPPAGVRDLEGALSKPRRVVESTIRLVLQRATGQDLDAQEAGPEAGTGAALLLDQTFNASVLFALGRPSLTRLLIAQEQIGGGTPSDPDTLRDLADLMSLGTDGRRHPLVDRAIAALEKGQEDGSDTPLSGDLEDAVKSMEKPPAAQEDAADALRQIAMRMDLRSPTRSVLSAALLAPARAAGIEAVGASAYVGTVRMASRAIDMARSDLAVAG